MTTPMTEADFAAKVEWEGGVVEALEYGLTYRQLPHDSQLRAAWGELELVYEDLGPLIDRVEKLLEAVQQ